MSLWVNVFILFVILWLIEGYLKRISNDLSYLIELLEQKSDLVSKQADQNKESNQKDGLDSKIPSREDLYR